MQTIGNDTCNLGLHCYVWLLLAFALGTLWEPLVELGAARWTVDNPTVSLPDHVHHDQAMCLVEGLTDADDVFCRMSHGEKLVACVSLEPHAAPNQDTWSCDLHFTEPGEWRLEHFAFRRDGRVYGPFYRSLKVEVMR